jgi:NAD(P)-dependent dehydrogenase (short-subunit alcohol dehydrogenase family)
VVRSISALNPSLNDALSGLALVQLLLSQDDTIVIAGARHPEPEAAKELHVLAQNHPNRLFPIKLISADQSSNHEAAEFVKEKFGRIDVVIANAGKLSDNGIKRHGLNMFLKRCDWLQPHRAFPSDRRSSRRVQGIKPRVTSCQI